MIITRRNFTAGLISALAAPAIIRPGILMPIKPSLVPALALSRDHFVVRSITCRNNLFMETLCCSLDGLRVINFSSEIMPIKLGDIVTFGIDFSRPTALIRDPLTEQEHEENR